MTQKFESVLEDILELIKDKKDYRIERDVTDRIIMPVLYHLGWPTHLKEIVKREQSTRDGKRVDFSLRDGEHKSKVFIEVKKLGRGDHKDAKIQALDYALKEEIPLAVLTDGRIWSFFYLPSEGRGYEERCFCKLDLLKKSIRESCGILHQYLNRKDVISGWVEKVAERVFDEKKLREEARRKIPDAWTRILNRDKSDSLLNQLIEGLAGEVEAREVVRPDDDDVVAFLRSLKEPVKSGGGAHASVRSDTSNTATTPPTPSDSMENKYPGILVRGNKKPRSKGLPHELLQAFFTGKNARRKLTYDDALHIGMEGGHDRYRVQYQLSHYLVEHDYIRFDEQAQGKRRKRKIEKSRRPRAPSGASGSSRSGELVILGKSHSCRNQNQATEIVFKKLQEEDPKFLHRFYEHSENQKDKYKSRRKGPRYLGRNYRELFGNMKSPRSCVKIGEDWVVSADYPWRIKKEIIELAAKVAGLKFGKNIILNFDD